MYAQSYKILHILKFIILLERSAIPIYFIPRFAHPLIEIFNIFSQITLDFCLVSFCIPFVFPFRNFL